MADGHEKAFGGDVGFRVLLELPDPDSGDPGAISQDLVDQMLRMVAAAGVRIAVVSPTDPAAMVRHVRELTESGTRYVYDPGQQIISLSPASLQAGVDGAHMLVGNDYEFAMMTDKTGLRREELEQSCDVVVVTFGELGSRIFHDGQSFDIPAVRPEDVVDPTGAGDGYRAGLLAGINASMPLDAAGRLGSLAATYVVESKGTQGHRFSLTEFAQRFEHEFPDHVEAALGVLFRDTGPRMERREVRPK
jgi:adenosine kinase